MTGWLLDSEVGRPFLADPVGQECPTYSPALKNRPVSPDVRTQTPKQKGGGIRPRLKVNFAAGEIYTSFLARSAAEAASGA